MENSTLLAAAIAALAALAGVFLQSRLTERASERDDDRRSKEQRATRLREHLLAEIEATQDQLDHDLQTRMNWLVGAPPPEPLPLATRRASRYSLIADQAVVSELGDLHGELQARRPGSLPTRDDMHRLNRLHRRADSLLRAQARRALADEPILAVAEQPAIDGTDPEGEADSFRRTEAFMDTFDAIVEERRKGAAAAMAEALVRAAKEQTASRLRPVSPPPPPQESRTHHDDQRADQSLDDNPAT